MNKDLLDAWRFVKSCDIIKPERLCTFLVRKGGIVDQHGDLSYMIGGSRGRPGLINNKSGMKLDHAAELCWEAGYIEGPPTINDLLAAIELDLTTEGVYKAEDQEAYQSWREQKLYEQMLDKEGLLHLTSVAQVMRVIGGIEEDEPNFADEVPF